MKYFLIALLLTINANCCFSQKINSIYDINLVLREIDHQNLKTRYEISGKLTYKFMDDSLSRQLRKVVVTDDNYKQEMKYYFKDDQLVYIRGAFGMAYFRDSDFTVGSTWKDENDIGLLKREKQIATAYRLLIMYKKANAQQWITAANNSLYAIVASVNKFFTEYF